YNYSPEELINDHLFYLEPGNNVFSPDAEPITYPDKCELNQLHLITRHGSRYPEAEEVLKYDRLEK
ncbi:18603_t:CDS:2, partial [Dentiscutata erythropus]